MTSTRNGQANQRKRPRNHSTPRCITPLASFSADSSVVLLLPVSAACPGSASLYQRSFVERRRLVVDAPHADPAEAESNPLGMQAARRFRLNEPTTEAAQVPGKSGRLHGWKGGVGARLYLRRRSSMMAAGRQKLAQASTYECSRCGDEYPLAGGDDELLVMIHRVAASGCGLAVRVGGGATVGPADGREACDGVTSTKGGCTRDEGGGTSLNVLEVRELLDAAVAVEDLVEGEAFEAAGAEVLDAERAHDAAEDDGAAKGGLV